MTARVPAGEVEIGQHPDQFRELAHRDHGAVGAQQQQPTVLSDAVDLELNLLPGHGGQPLDRNHLQPNHADHSAMIPHAARSVVPPPPPGRDISGGELFGPQDLDAVRSQPQHVKAGMVDAGVAVSRQSPQPGGSGWAKMSQTSRSTSSSSTHSAVQSMATVFWAGLQ